MRNLEHIDLTQGRRFQNDDNQLQISSNDRGIRRLKKGEIPHHSLSTTSVTNIPLSTTTTSFTISTNSSIDDWVVSIDNAVFENVTWMSTSELDNRIMNSTNTTSNNIRWNLHQINTDNDLLTIDTSTFITTTTSSGYLYSNNIDNLYSWTDPRINRFTDDTPVSSRIFADPFTIYEIDSSSNALYKLHNYNYDNLTGNENRRSIRNRIAKDLISAMAYHSGWYESMNDDALYRLRPDREMDDYFDKFLPVALDDRIKADFSHTERNLKKKAPFIKHIYVTNGGHSFDSTELRLDLLIAKEHFDELVSKLLAETH